MKKALHLILIFIFLSSFLTIGKGVDLVQCSCSGEVTMVPCGTVEDEDGCDASDGCLDVIHVELSPVSQAHSQSEDTFLSVVPECLVPDWIYCWLRVDAVTVVRPTCVPIVRGAPPRDYLNLIQILLI